MASDKTTTVSVGVDRSVKKQAEATLSRMGLPRFATIGLFYRQAINSCGIPLSLTIPESKFPAYDEMSAAEFDWVKATGLAQAMADDSFDLDEVFGGLEAGLNGWV